MSDLKPLEIEAFKKDSSPLNTMKISLKLDN